MKKTFSIYVRSEFRKWDMLKSPGGQKAIVINSVNESHGATLTVFPYKSPKKKWLRMLKFNWLKLRVWLKIIR